MTPCISPFVTCLLITVMFCPTSMANAQNTDSEMIITGKVWQWETTVTPVERIKVTEPQRYTIRLKNDGNAEIRIDCNYGHSEYTLKKNTFSFGPLISTRKNCSADSQAASFIHDLQRVTSFFVEEGYLYMELAYHSGVMKFAPRP